jgi:alpha-1,3-mannosylglycoprotein beta-1,4-N-acetylglucosaminyltransferase A/B
MVLGLPTVKRDHQSYLQSTLRSIFNNISPEDTEDTLVVVFIAETEPSFVASVAKSINASFSAQIEAGILDVISPPPEYYPDWSSLKPTLGDPPERVQWRSKQNLDYAFLMMYCQWRGVYYVQLEDDILTKPNFVATMRDFALEKTAAKEPWFVIDYCQLGFIGKMFSSSSLPILIQFFLSFYNDKPGDWLLDNVIQTKVCKMDQDFKKCQKEKNALWIHYKPSLFQHIGTHSSLKGKVQKLKDKQFGKVSLFAPHRNPPATFETKIKHYKHYSITRAYKGETFYWGLVPQPGDYILFRLNPPCELSGYKFVSGNAEHPSDRFEKTTVEVQTEDASVDNEILKLTKTRDGFLILGEFDENGVAEDDIEHEYLGKIKAVRLRVAKVHDNWAILSEIHLKTTALDKVKA